MSTEPLWRGTTLETVGSGSRLSSRVLPVPSGTELEVWPAGDRPTHDHDAWLDHLINEWGHLGVVMQVLKALTDEQAKGLLDAARARVELTPESLGAPVPSETENNDDADR